MDCLGRWDEHQMTHAASSYPSTIERVGNRGSVSGFPQEIPTFSSCPWLFFSDFLVSATFHCLFRLFQLSAASKKTFRVSANFKLCFPVSTIFSHFFEFPWLKIQGIQVSGTYFFCFPQNFFTFPVFCDFFKAFPAFRQKYYRPSL